MSLVNLPDELHILILFSATSYRVGSDEDILATDRATGRRDLRKVSEM